MNYSQSNISGDAGEYFLAYQFTKVLGWPCRLYGQDLGIDAEVEILDDQGHSTGDVLKIQVKSSQELIPTQEGKVSINVTASHVSYWQNFCLPVIVCAVDLRTESIYWNSIALTEDYSTRGESNKVVFDTTEDLFTDAAKEAFRSLVSPNQTLKIKDLLDKGEALLLQIPMNTYVDFADWVAITDAEQVLNELDVMVNELYLLFGQFAWKATIETRHKLAHIKEHIRRTKIYINAAKASLANGG
jgi:hypothetical protein